MDSILTRINNNREINHTRVKLDTEEGQKKAEELFSKKFIEYLSNKKSSVPPTKNKTRFSPPSDDTTDSESSRTLEKKHRKSHPKGVEYNDGCLDKATQYSQLKVAQEVETPDDLNTLLINVTILLQQLKESPSENENLLNLISKITILVTEFTRRPIKKTQDQPSQNIDKTIEAILTLLEEQKSTAAMDTDNVMREFKRIERELGNKDQAIGELKKKLSAACSKEGIKSKDLNTRVRESIIYNEKLKASIKFNHSHIKKYKKMLMEKEWMKHKLENDMTHLKKKISKVDIQEGGDGTDTKIKSPELSLKVESVTKSVTAQKPTPAKPKKEKEKSQQANKSNK